MKRLLRKQQNKENKKNFVMKVAGFFFNRSRI